MRAPNMFDDIDCSYAPADESMIDATERALSAKLPGDYITFLMAHNGGFARELRYTFLTGVPFKNGDIYTPSRDDCVVEFFGVSVGASNDHRPADLVRTAEMHRVQPFLPKGVIAVARCMQNSLVCISLREPDLGTIYYWDYYWRYPWCKEFFDRRIDAARARLEAARDAEDGAARPDPSTELDALNFATLVKLAPSFSEWSHSCFDGRDVA